MAYDEEILRDIHAIQEDFDNCLLTKMDATYRLLSGIDSYGAERVLNQVSPELRHLVREWASNAPKSTKGWKTQRVFEFREGVAGLPEAVAVSMSDKEIEGRLRVVESVLKYFAGRGDA